MIKADNNIFHITSKSTSYIFRVTRYGHLEHIYYGSKIDPDDIEPLRYKQTAVIGSQVLYKKDDETYCLDNMLLEYSSIGEGDYRNTPLEVKLPDGSYTCNFVYEAHELVHGSVNMKELPNAYSEDNSCESLLVTLKDTLFNIKLLLVYSVFPDKDVITRRVVLINNEESSITIRKIMSLMLDMPDKEYKLITFDGGWIKEAHRHDRMVSYGIHVNSSVTGNSSNRHNPGFLVCEKNCSEMTGRVYGFNLIYSSNHYSAVELSNNDIVRIMIGINPCCFEWTLCKNDSFEAPEAVLTFSENGFNGLSNNFHGFINDNIVRGDYKKKERPIVLNSWEAHFFKFTHRSLLKLAKQAGKLGVELFVLDDGWFGERDDDSKGLGDYTVNKKKFPHGMKKFSKKLKETGLQFGLWFEPEMVNENSRLYKEHPEFAVKINQRNATYGRNQLVLDLCKTEVRDYIVENVSRIIDEYEIAYVKWDMNRNISDFYSSVLVNQGEFFHRYILGLYDILERIFISRPHVLLESCASGGNRFDLGMLCYSPQIWSSDNTDPIERLKIQTGLSYLYPVSTMGAHVSGSPHQQTLRKTPLSTRFNVAAFGCLGYELDLKYLTRVEKKEIKEQIAFYKTFRKVFQFGTFYRIENRKSNKVVFQCVDKQKQISIMMFAQTLANASEGYDRLQPVGLDEQYTYEVETKSQKLYIKQFGELIKHILPIELNPEGVIIRTVNKFRALDDCVEKYKGTGATLMKGILLQNQFMGSYYNHNTRLLSDYGSNLYVIKRKTL